MSFEIVMASKIKMQFTQHFNKKCQENYSIKIETVIKKCHLINPNYVCIDIQVCIYPYYIYVCFLNIKVLIIKS